MKEVLAVPLEGLLWADVACRRTNDNRGIPQTLDRSENYNNVIGLLLLFTAPKLRFIASLDHGFKLVTLFVHKSCQVVNRSENLRIRWRAHCSYLRKALQTNRWC